jgi:ABC-type multidrug transport system ATPase subunit
MIWILLLLFYINPVFSCQLDEYLVDNNCAKCVAGLYCSNNTGRLCKSGFYCPNFSQEIECTKSHFCLEGSTSQIPCILGELTCPDFGMNKQLPFVAGIFYASILFILINLLFYLIKIYYDFKSNNFESRLLYQNRIQRDFKHFIPHLKRWVSRKRSESEISIEIDENKYLIEFKEIKLEINNRKILDNVTGFFVSGKINVLMGESGSGKSSLINILIGKLLKKSKIKGNIYINNKKIKSLKTAYKKSLVYIEQFYKFYENLTVEENIYYYHLLFTNKTNFQLEKSVKYYLNILELESIKDLQVGNENRGGISGGQRKKLSIAMELVRDPEILVFDEPTSGLDSASSIKIFRIFKKLSNLGKTVIVSIHQPRRELLAYFDYVSIMMIGGNLIYCGEKKKIINYFQNLGYYFNNNNNIMDFVIDIVAGITRRINVIDESKEENLLFLKNSWKQNFLLYKPVDHKYIKFNFTEKFSIFNEIYKFYNLFKRNVYIIYRNKSNLITNFFFTMFLGFFIGTVYGNKNINGLVFQLHSSLLILSLISVFNGVSVFGNKIIYQELFNGLNIFSIVLAKFAAFMFFDIITVFIYTISWLNNTQLRYVLTTIYFDNLLIYWVISGIANFISIILNKKSITQISYFFVVMLWVLNGVSPSYETLNNNLNSDMFSDILLTITPLNEAIKVLIKDELINYPLVFNGYISQIYQDYKIDDNYNYTMYLFVFGLAFKILSILTIFIIYKIKFKN